MEGGGRIMIPRIVLILVFMIIGYLVEGCQSGGGGGFGGSSQSQNSLGGTEPINQKEQLQYQKSLLKCVKSGGSRIVKIEGDLRCY
jgi:hypothetical protein